MEQTKNEILFELANGTKVILSKANTSASYVGLFLASGSRDDGDLLGVSHLIEHAIFKGTGKHSYSELMNMIESVGGEMNAYTAKEETCFQVAIARKDEERAFELLSEIFYDSVFPSAELEKEKTVVIDEMESYEDMPNEKIFDEFEELLFEGNSLARNILGTKKSIMKMKQTELVGVHERLYRPSQLVVSYVGGSDFEEVARIVEQYFGRVDVKKRPEFVQRTKFVPRGMNFNIVKNKRTHQAHCMLGTIAPAIGDNMRFVAAMLTSILGGVSFNALLNMRLREERGLTYNIEANYTPYSDVGVFSVYFGTDYSKVEVCREVIQDLFNEIITNGFAADKLEACKQQMIGQIAVSDDNYMSLMLNNAKAYWWFGRVDSFDEVVQKINGITNEMVKQVAQQILSLDNMNVLIYK